MYFHTITSILKLASTTLIAETEIKFPYDYVYFKACSSMTTRLEAGGELTGFPYDYVYFKACFVKIHPGNPHSQDEFPYDYVYFKAGCDTKGIRRRKNNFHTITSILKLDSLSLHFVCSLIDDFHTITSILKRIHPGLLVRSSGFPYDYVYFKATLL